VERAGTVAGGRLGIYGGTFNPLHAAHLMVAEEIRERMRLDRILFVPSGVPPHKSGRMPDGRQRLAMVRLAVRGNPFFSALALEVKREGRSFTIETLQVLRRRHPLPADFFFLIGMDAFEEITTWKDAGHLADHAHLVIFPRPGHPLVKLEPFLPGSWKTGHTRTSGRTGIRKIALDGKKALFTVPMETPPLSASAVRRRIRGGRSIRYLVPETVRRFIEKNNLYQKQQKGD
jgi:nicotinate-nucleotide adenylyltransferase